MNKNSKVFWFILLTSSVLLVSSFFSYHIIKVLPSFKNINILSEVELKIKIKETKKKQLIKKNLGYSNFDSYLTSNSINNFYNDEHNVSLINFNKKLVELSHGKKIKIRIAWFGDSVIEGDLVTKDLRAQMQNYFDPLRNKAVGFIPIRSASSENRVTGIINTEGNFETSNFKTAKQGLFLSGYYYNSNFLEIKFVDNLKKNPIQKLEKWLLYGKGDSIEVMINSQITKYSSNNSLNRILLDNNLLSKVDLKIKSKNTPIFGISSEVESGIVLDNYSFRGITGIELNRIDTSLLQGLNSANYYDLVVLQYGVNLMFSPKNVNYDDYYLKMTKVLSSLKNNMPKSDFLLLSCTDRAFKYDGQWKTAIGIDSLIKIQAKLAFENKMSFYNLHKSMGGKGSIVKWADSTNRLANKDYIHFNNKGASVVASILFKALVNDYNKSNDSKKKSININ